MPFVLDNSVVACWYLPDQRNDYSQSIAQRLKRDRALVPALWQMELANVLRTACNKGKLNLAQARQVMDNLAQLPIELDASPAPAQRPLFELAMRHGLSSYDAIYLELAMRHGLPIATRDADLKRAAMAAGVDLVV